MQEKGLKFRITGEARDAERAFNSLHGHAEKFGKAMKVAAAAAAAALTGLAYGMKQCLDAAAEEEKAIAMLSDSMRQHGTYSDEALASLKDFAAEQQRLTTFADEATIAAMQQLQTFGMDIETMKQATKVAQDLAAAKGIDLNTAVNLVGKAYAGNTAMLGRYGIVLDQAKLQAEGFTYVMGEMNRMFGGAAAAEADTYTGRVQQMKNAWGDLQEKIGYAVMPALKDLAVNLGEVFRSIDISSLEGAFGVIGDIVSGFLPTMQKGLEVVIGLMAKIGPVLTDAFGRIGEMLIEIVDMAVSSGLLDLLTEVGSLLIDTVLDVLESMMPVVRALIPPVTRIASLALDALKKIMPLITKLADILGNTIASIINRLSPIIERVLSTVLRILEPVVDLVAGTLTVALQILEPLISGLLAIVEAGLNIIGPLLEWTVGLVGKVVSGIGDFIGGIFGVGESTSNIEALNDSLSTTDQKLSELQSSWPDLSIAERTAQLDFLRAEYIKQQALGATSDQLKLLEDGIVRLSDSLYGNLSAVEDYQSAWTRVEENISTMTELNKAEQLETIRRMAEAMVQEGGEVPDSILMAWRDADPAMQEFVRASLEGIVGHYATFDEEIKAKSTDIVNALLQVFTMPLDTLQQIPTGYFSELNASLGLSAGKIDEILRSITKSAERETQQWIKNMQGRIQAYELQKAQLENKFGEEAQALDRMIADCKADIDSLRRMAERPIIIDVRIIRRTIGEPEQGGEQHGGGLIRHSGGLIPSLKAAVKHFGGRLLADERIVIAQAGEYMMRRAAVQTIGVDTLEYMNRTGKVPVGVSGGDINFHFNFNGTVISDDRSWEALARKIQFRYGPRVARALGV